jgi:hypothetical protein
MNLWVSNQAGNLLTSWGTVSFRRRARIHGSSPVTSRSMSPAMRHPADFQLTGYPGAQHAVWRNALLEWRWWHLKTTQWPTLYSGLWHGLQLSHQCGTTLEYEAKKKNTRSERRTREWKFILVGKEPTVSGNLYLHDWIRHQILLRWCTCNTHTRRR